MSKAEHNAIPPHLYMPASKSRQSSNPPEILKNVLPFLEDAEQQLAATDHFGVLAPLLETVGERTQRLDYVRSQCILLHRLKKTVQGLGLGSSNNFPPANSDPHNDWKPVRSMTGLEIVQSWVVLVNAGHLFGTFATERPLLFQLDRDLELRQEFVAGASSYDVAEGRPLRTQIQIMLDKGRLPSFHSLLALWRVRKDGPTKLGGSDLRRAQLLLKAFLLPPTEKLRSLLMLFKRVRRLTYLEVHGDLQQTQYTLPSLKDADLRVLFPEDALPEADWIARAKWDVYEALDRFDAESLFSSGEAAAEILTHVAEFRQWWAQSKVTKTNRIDSLYSRPVDWPIQAPHNLHHFIELRVPSTVGWLHEVRHWLRDDREQDPWGTSNFFVSPALRDEPLRIDLYTSEEGLSVSTLRHVLLQLARPYSGVGAATDLQPLWMSSARLLARVFESSLKPQHKMRLRPTLASPGHIGYATIGSTYEFVRGRMKSFLPLSTDQQRSKELRQLLSVADEVVGWRTPAFALLARSEIMSHNVTGSEMITELDGVLGFYRGDELCWLVIETKKLGSDNGEKQLRNKFFSALKVVDSTQEISRRDYGPDQVWFTVLKSAPYITRLRPLGHAGRTESEGRA
jgi:hypothetical protein